jgi:hypothetical protein
MNPPKTAGDSATGNWNWQPLFANFRADRRRMIIQSIKILRKKIPFDFHLLRCQNLYGNATILSGNPLCLSGKSSSESPMQLWRPRAAFLSLNGGNHG